MQGWIKLHRELTKWEWYQDANTMRGFLHVLLMANHKQAKWKGNVIERGQLITSREHLANELGLSIQNVRTSLSKLKKSENLTIKSTKQFTLISVCNYDTYQSSEVQANQQTNQQLTNDQPTTNQQLTTNKNDKNKNNEKNEEEGKNESEEHDEYERARPVPDTKIKSKHRVENIEERFIRMVKRDVTPRRLTFNAKELSALKRIKKPLEEHDMGLLEHFFSQPKAVNFDQTWKRKQEVVTLLNNIDDQLDLAYEYKETESKKYALPKQNHTQF